METEKDSSSLNARKQKEMKDMSDTEELGQKKENVVIRKKRLDARIYRAAFNLQIKKLKQSDETKSQVCSSSKGIDNQGTGGGKEFQQGAKYVIERSNSDSRELGSGKKVELANCDQMVTPVTPEMIFSSSSEDRMSYGFENEEVCPFSVDKTRFESSTCGITFSEDRTPDERLPKSLALGQSSDSVQFVECWVPVHLSEVQLEQYCDTLLSNSTSLCSSSMVDSDGVASDIILSLSKCCDHPYLVDASLQSILTKGFPMTEHLRIGVNASGKLQLLDKILAEIKIRGLRVLILFQLIIGSERISVGDILDDFLYQQFGRDCYERVDDDLLASKKQAALDRFNDKEQGRFVLLIEKRACRRRIKVLAVDIVIIFDSEWNPKSDLRALQKMCIYSQFEQLQVFRLYSCCTVEEKLLILAKQDKTPENRCKRKLSSSTRNNLLRWGASYLFNKLHELHSFTSHNFVSSASYLPVLNDLVSELLTHLPNGAESSYSNNNSVIVEFQHSEESYTKNVMLLGELEMQLTNEGLHHVFWSKLLLGRLPQWRYLPRSSQFQRARKKVQYYEKLPRKPETAGNKASRKCKKVSSNPNDPGGSTRCADYSAESSQKFCAYVDVCGGLSIPALCSSSREPVAQMIESEKTTLSDAQKKLYFLLKHATSELCQTLQLPPSSEKTQFPSLAENGNDIASNCGGRDDNTPQLEASGLEAVDETSLPIEQSSCDQVSNTNVQLELHPSKHVHSAEDNQLDPPPVPRELQPDVELQSLSAIVPSDVCKQATAAVGSKPEQMLEVVPTLSVDNHVVKCNQPTILTATVVEPEPIIQLQGCSFSATPSRVTNQNDISAATASEANIMQLEPASSTDLLADCNQFDSSGIGSRSEPQSRIGGQSSSCPSFEMQLSLLGIPVVNQQPLRYHEPLKNEVTKLCAMECKMSKMQEDMRTQLISEYEKEVLLARQNYDHKVQDLEKTFVEMKESFNVFRRKVHLNMMLARAFREKYSIVGPGLSSTVQQLPMQSMSQSAQRPLCAPGPSVEVVHNTSALFSSNSPVPHSTPVIPSSTAIPPSNLPHGSEMQAPPHVLPVTSSVSAYHLPNHMGRNWNQVTLQHNTYLPQSSWFQSEFHTSLSCAPIPNGTHFPVVSGPLSALLNSLPAPNVAVGGGNYPVNNQSEPLPTLKYGSTFPTNHATTASGKGYTVVDSVNPGTPMNAICIIDDD